MKGRYPELVKKKKKRWIALWPLSSAFSFCR